MLPYCTVGPLHATPSPPAPARRRLLLVSFQVHPLHSASSLLLPNFLLDSLGRLRQVGLHILPDRAVCVKGWGLFEGLGSRAGTKVGSLSAHSLGEKRPEKDPHPSLPQLSIGQPPQTVRCGQMLRKPGWASEPPICLSSSCHGGDLPTL